MDLFYNKFPKVEDNYNLKNSIEQCKGYKFESF